MVTKSTGTVHTVWFQREDVFSSANDFDWAFWSVKRKVAANLPVVSLILLGFDAELSAMSMASYCSGGAAVKRIMLLRPFSFS